MTKDMIRCKMAYLDTVLILAPKTPPLALDSVLLIVCWRDTSLRDTVSDIYYTTVQHYNHATFYEMQLHVSTGAVTSLLWHTWAKLELVQTRRHPNEM